MWSKRGRMGKRVGITGWEGGEGDGGGGSVRMDWDRAHRRCGCGHIGGVGVG